MITFTMSSVRYFYFFICLSILFFVSLQMNDENTENATNSTTIDLNQKIPTCTTNLEEVEKNFSKSFHKYKHTAKHSISFRQRKNSKRQPADSSVLEDKLHSYVKNKVQGGLEYFSNLLSFCQLAWLTCYNKNNYLAAKDVSVDSIHRAIIENIDEGETSNTNRNNEEEQINSMYRNNEEQQINKMINNLPMFGCTALEGEVKFRFFISLFEQFFSGIQMTKRHFYIFEGNAENEKPINVKLNAYMRLTHKKTELANTKIKSSRN